MQRATAAIGLRPPAYYGTEVVARFLGLRYDHPAGTDQLELFPWDPITRAEAAWSLAQVMDDGSWSIASARQALMAYALPRMTADQLTALRIAVSRIGYPYVYAGTTDDTADGLAHGGFDCSGFVWRVFKVSGLPSGRQIGGRTAAQMAQEIPHRDRLRYDQLRPGRPAVLRQRSLQQHGHRGQRHPRRHLSRRQLGHPLLGPGGVRAPAARQLAGRPVRLGPARAVLDGPAGRLVLSATGLAGRRTGFFILRLDESGATADTDVDRHPTPRGRRARAGSLGA